MEPLLLILNGVWLPFAFIILCVATWKLGRRMIAARRKPWFPILVVFLLALFLTPVPNRYDEYVVSAIVWLGLFFVPSQFIRSMPEVIIACGIVTLAGWSILLAAGLFKWRAG